MSTTPRWVRSARSRPAAFVAILLLSAGAVLVSATTPMLLGAVDAVTLREDVAAAAFPSNGISSSAVAQSVDQIADAEAAVQSVIADAAGSDRFGSPLLVTQPQVAPVLFGPGRPHLASGFSLAPSSCAEIRLTGRCPSEQGQAALPASMARSEGWTVGTRIVVKTSDPSSNPPFRPLTTLTVVGVYDDGAGLGRALADPTVLEQSAAPRAVSNVVIGIGEAHVVAQEFRTTGAVRLTRPVREQDVAALRAATALARNAALDQGAADVSTTVRTDLPALLQEVSAQQAAAGVLAAPVGLEAVLLAWFALGAVVQRTSRSRAAEWGVGRMRGARPPAWLAAVFTEPLVAIVLGAIVGFASSLLVSAAAAALLLGSAADLEPFAPPVLVSAGLAFAGSIVALTAASVRAALLPLPELLQDTAEPRRSTRAALVGQVALVALALAVGWSAATGAGLSGQQLGLLLPAMLAIVVGLAAVRVAVLVVRRSSERPPRSLTGLVVGRGLARAPSALLAAQLVLVSAALAAFALQLGVVSTAVQTGRAELATGAAEVLSVRVPPGASLLDLVRRADPGGRAALAAAEIAGDPTTAGGKVLALDVSRLAAVSTWAPEWRRGVDLARLAPAQGDGLRLTGSVLRLRIADLIQSSDGDRTDPSRIGMSAELEDDEGWFTADLGELHDGEVQADVHCDGGCRLIALETLDETSSGLPWTASFTVTALSTDRQPAADFQSWLRGPRWRERVSDLTDPTRPGRTVLASAARGLKVEAADRDGGATAEIEPADGPDLVPAVLGADADLVRFPGLHGAVLGTSVGGAPTVLRVVARATAVPRSLRTGVVVDLRTVERAEDPSLFAASQQVWLAPGDHAAVLRSLHDAGVRVGATRTAAAAVDQALRSATNRAVLISGVTAVVGVLFGLLALIGTRLIDMPERRREWRVLQLAGVPLAASRRLALVQTSVPALIGVLLGAVAGSAAATAIAGRLPLVVGVSAGPPVDEAPPLLPLAALVLALMALVLVSSVVVTAIEVGRTRR